MPEDERDEMMIRMLCLLAASFSATRGVSENTVIARAKKFRRYLERGE